MTQEEEAAHHEKARLECFVGVTYWRGGGPFLYKYKTLDIYLYIWNWSVEIWKGFNIETK